MIVARVVLAHMRSGRLYGIRVQALSNSVSKSAQTNKRIIGHVSRVACRAQVPPRRFVFCIARRVVLAHMRSGYVYGIRVQVRFQTVSKAVFVFACVSGLPAISFDIRRSITVAASQPVQCQRQCQCSFIISPFAQ